ncbi:DUF2064 domain-containing protein, partial [Nocardia carnea]|uniref:DUF2064 domain-containing protein n=1 Tax=Nocardia carnea TaxID=37328 RepID=UPI0024584809
PGVLTEAARSLAAGAEALLGPAGDGGWWALGLSDPRAARLLTGRADDAWLANWSRAEAVASHPIDPLRLTEIVVDLLSRRTAAAPPGHRF